jgi:hypothetical protein
MGNLHIGQKTTLKPIQIIGQLTNLCKLKNEEGTLKGEE